jgi:hypothetical protein
MDLPQSLPARLYLLAYDVDKGRQTARAQIGLVLRAAALAELCLQGRLADDRDKVQVVSPQPVGDPVVDALLEQVATGSRKSWRLWIGRRERALIPAVRDQLEALGWLKIERRTILPDRIELRDAYKIKEYTAQVRQALTAPTPSGDAGVGALLALAAVGDVKSLVSHKDRRTYKRRLEELGDPVAPVVHGLKRALQTKRAAAASS